VGEALVQRAHGGRADGGRRVEVRLPDLEVHDGASLGLERPRLGEHLEGGLRSELAHPIRVSHRSLRSVQSRLRPIHKVPLHGPGPDSSSPRSSV